MRIIRKYLFRNPPEIGTPKQVAQELRRQYEQSRFFFTWLWGFAGCIVILSLIFAVRSMNEDTMLFCLSNAAVMVVIGAYSAYQRNVALRNIHSLETNDYFRQFTRPVNIDGMTENMMVYVNDIMAMPEEDATDERMRGHAEWLGLTKDQERQANYRIRALRSQRTANLQAVKTEAFVSVEKPKAFKTRWDMTQAESQYLSWLKDWYAPNNPNMDKQKKAQAQRLNLATGQRLSVEAFFYNERAKEEQKKAEQAAIDTTPLAVLTELPQLSRDEQKFHDWLIKRWEGNVVTDEVTEKRFANVCDLDESQHRRVAGIAHREFERRVKAKQSKD